MNSKERMYAALNRQPTDRIPIFMWFHPATAALLNVQPASGYGKRIDKMAGDGGFILAASHTIPPETPLDNIFAMYQRGGVSKEMILDNAYSIRSRIGDNP